MSQCPEGLITRKPAMLSDGQVSIADDEMEYRCEQDKGHPDSWHRDGDFKWQTY